MAGQAGEPRVASVGRLQHVLLILAALTAMGPPAIAADPLTLYAAGSLKAALTDVAKAYQEAYGTPVTTEFAASGLLRERIEGGEPADLFASANMAHPATLLAAGWGGPVALFARNQLCALAQPEVKATPANLLDVLLDPDVRLGTSTPKADPSGDHAWRVFEQAEVLRPGRFAILDAKALKLTSGPDSEKAPEGRNTYGWVMEPDRADVFLTYCTNAVLAQREVPELQIVSLPDELAVGADYGLIVRKDAPDAAWRLALFILAPEGQSVLADYGFTSGALPKED
jgi:ABC-type molybdate transport system substrate-binding protein